MEEHEEQKEGRETEGGREGLDCEDKQMEEMGVWEGEGREELKEEKGGRKSERKRERDGHEWEKGKEKK